MAITPPIATLPELRYVEASMQLSSRAPSIQHVISIGAFVTGISAQRPIIAAT